MAFEQKDFSGSLFRNDRKETDKHPDFTGSAKIDGVEYWVSGWTKQPKDGKKGFLSLAFNAKDESRRPKADNGFSDPKQKAAGARSDNFEDDIPF